MKLFNILPLCILIVCGVVLTSCSSSTDKNQTGDNDYFTQEYKTFDYQKHECAFCDEHEGRKRFGALIEKQNGDEISFLATECMAGYILENPGKISSDDKLYVVDYHYGDRLLTVEEARFLRTDLLQSPTGLHLIAFGGKEKMNENLRVAYGGEVIDWEAVKAYVKSEWQLAGH